MGPGIIPSSTRKGDPLTGSHEEGVLYGPFPDCFSVSGIQGQSGGPDTNKWDVPLCVCVCVCVCVHVCVYRQGASILTVLRRCVRGGSQVA